MRRRRKAAWGNEKAGREARPEFFWIGAIVLLTVATLGVYRPACHARSAARARYARIAGEVEAHRAKVEDLRETRAALERGDPIYWEAEGRGDGMVRPGERPARDLNSGDE